MQTGMVRKVLMMNRDIGFSEMPCFSNVTPFRVGWIGWDDVGLSRLEYISRNCLSAFSWFMLEVQMAMLRAMLPLTCWVFMFSRSSPMLSCPVLSCPFISSHRFLIELRFLVERCTESDLFEHGTKPARIMYARSLQPKFSSSPPLLHTCTCHFLANTRMTKRYTEKDEKFPKIM